MNTSRNFIPALLLPLFLLAVLTGCSPKQPGTALELASGDYEYLAVGSVEDPFLLKPFPAPGDTVETDPPGFTWQPEEGAVGFLLEVSRDPLFRESDGLTASLDGHLVPGGLQTDAVSAKGDMGYAVAGLPLNLHRPSFTLGSGEWHWRWRNVFAGGALSPPSEARAFVVAESAVEYTVPPVSELLANIPAEHPRVLVRPEQVDSLRALRESSPAHAGMWEMIRTYTDTSLISWPLMQEPPPFPEGPFNYDLWRTYYEQARKMGQVLDFLGFCYLVSGEARYAQRAREWLLHLTTWDLEGTSSMSYNDEVAMPVVLNASRAFDWIYDTLEPAERQKIAEMLIARCEQAYARWWSEGALYHRNPFSSHRTRLINYLSQAGCALRGEGTGPEKWLSYILPIVTTFYPAWGGRDGGYSEGPSYWLMYFNYMLQSAHCIDNAMGLDVMRKPFYRNVGWYKIFGDPWFAAQNPFADTGIGAYWPANKMNLYRLASVYDNGHFLWRSRNSPPEDHLPVGETKVPSGVMSYLWLDPQLERMTPQPPADLPKAYLFGDIGLAAFHEDPADPDEVYLLFKSSPYGAWSHTYADQNSFYIQGFGEALAIQSGYYPHYSHPHHKEWTWHTRAHNSVLVDGVGQKIRDRGSRGRIIEFSPGPGVDGSLDYAAGDATEAYDGRLEKFIRRVFYQRPHDFMIVDELRAPGDVRFDWLLHAHEKMVIDERSRTVTIRRGRARLTAEFVQPENLRFSQTDRFTEDPGESWDQPGYFYPDQWHLTVSTQDKSRSAVFVVKIHVWRE